MPTRPDLRQISTDIRAALSDVGRDELADILTQVFREYVVEGPPPLPVPPASIDGLEGLSFAEVIAALQLRLDVPELELFEVEGDVVRVRVRGELVPLRSSGRAAGSAGADAPRPGEGEGGERPAAPSARAPGVRVVETPLDRMPPAEPTGRASVDEAVARGRGDLAGVGGAAQPVAPTAPRPRGIAVAGRPSAAGAQSPAGRSSSAAQPPGGSAGAARAPSGGEERPEGGGEAEAGSGDDIASVRFSLLELD